jgi:hypothetical protein
MDMARFCPRWCDCANDAATVLARMADARPGARPTALPDVTKTARCPKSETPPHGSRIRRGIGRPSRRGTKLDSSLGTMKKNRNKQPERSDTANAFIPVPEQHGGPVDDDLAEYLGENFLTSATGGDDSGDALQDEVVVEELGGPFVETDADSEFGASRTASATDETVEVEAFPTAVRSGRSSLPPRRE